MWRCSRSTAPAPDPGGARRAAPGRGQVAADRRLRRNSTNDNSRPAALKAALIDAADPASCTLVSESFDPSWLFCGEAATDPAVPGGTSCYGDSGGPAFAYENTVANLVVEGVISYGSGEECEFSRSYLVLVSSERGFIDRALATPPPGWGKLRDLPPKAKVRALHRRLNQRGMLTLRVDDDKSRHSRVAITFYDARRQADLAGVPQRPDESLGDVQDRQSLEGVPGLRLRTGHGRDEEAVEHRVRGQRHRVTAAPAVLHVACPVEK